MSELRETITVPRTVVSGHQCDNCYKVNYGASLPKEWFQFDEYYPHHGEGDKLEVCSIECLLVYVSDFANCEHVPEDATVAGFTKLNWQKILKELKPQTDEEEWEEYKRLRMKFGGK